MKKQVLTLTTLLGFAIGATMAQAYTASIGVSNGGGVVKSKHNMNTFLSANGKTGDMEKRVCAFCHTPHHSIGIGESVTISDNNGGNMTYNVYAPLWSRDLSLLKTTYDPYQSATFNPVADKKIYDNLMGPSRLCMTCHDGNVAADAYYGQTGTSGISGDDTLTMFGNGNFGIGKDLDLSNDHPIGFKYNDYQKDATGRFELRPADTAKFPKDGETDASATGKLVQDVLWTDATSGITGPDNAFMTCASCHDVHNGPDVGNTNPVNSGRGYFLRGTQVNSYFCLTCHDKNK